MICATMAEGPWSPGALTMVGALERAGHEVRLVRMDPDARQLRLLPASESDRLHPDDARALRPAAWFVSIMHPRQILGLPALFERLDLAPRSRDRRPSDPLVAIGGFAALAPAPFAAFADVVAFGDAEITAPAIARACALGREAAMSSLAGRDGLWVPEIGPRRLVRATLDALPPATLLRPGQGRAPVFELARGCARACPFCALGWTAGPRRTRELPAGATGNLLSCDGLSATGTSRNRMASASSPGAYIGIDGLSERLRRAIGKPLSHERLCALAASGDMRKWYLILGLPGETDADLDEFLDVLAHRGARTAKDFLMITGTLFQAIPHTPLGRLPNAYDPAAAARAQRLRWWATEHQEARVLVSEPKGRELHESDVYLQRGGQDVAEHCLAIPRSWWTDARWRRDAPGLEDALGSYEGRAAPWDFVDPGARAASAPHALATYAHRVGLSLTEGT